MKTVILITITVLLSSLGRAQCTADFSSATTNFDAYFTNLSVSPFTTYDWNFGDGTNSTSTNPTHTYASLGVYTVCLASGKRVLSGSLFLC